MSDIARNAGIQALKDGDPKAALQHLGQAVAENPQDTQAHAYLGMACGQLGMLDKAVKSLRTATRLSPQSAALRYNLGTALERAGKKAEAVAEYREALAKDGSYARAREALTRLGESAATPAAPAPPGSPGAATVGDFLLGSSPAAPAQGGGFRPGATIPAGAPPPSFGPPAGPPGYAPPGYGPPAGPPAHAPAQGMSAPSETVVDWRPPGAGGPPGVQPLGEWAPAPGASPPPGYGPPAGPPGYGAPPGYGPPGGPAPAPAGEPVIATADAPERSMTASEQKGHAYLAGLGKGVWWGLFVILAPIIRATMLQAAVLQANMLVVVTLCLMCIALGCLLYGGIGLLSASSDDAEQTCGNLGLAVGGVTALVFLWVFQDFILYLGVPLAIGAVAFSRMLGTALGKRLNEMNTSVFIVSGPRGVAMTPHRPH